ncbi:ribonuclease III [Metallumcola ferriviriculae]|uniref:Ribonuclease 3 n=1 Tax=Metallumcola ferriviriculae TaxID=3039180 RepID=A0AAU0UQS2_9FIRM|nr:ribonuclease III [Desulfitibacteraceae bacterium MK1]
MEQNRARQLQELITRSQLVVESADLINQALVHPTYVFENPNIGLAHNQRLEFLGDAVLDLVVARYLYDLFPDKPEGELTKIRAAVVCEAALARAAQQIDLGKYLLLGRGEEMTGGRQRPSILADAFEALIAAIYLDAEMEQAAKFIHGILDKEIEQASSCGNYGDYKTVLQERIQKQYTNNAQYTILEEFGPDHDKRFIAGVILKDKLLAQGQGRSKKEAEQQAAKAALEMFDERK